VMKMIVAALQNRDITVYGSGEQMRSFCWVGDVVDGLVRLMHAPQADGARTVNLGSDHEVSIRALAEKIVELTGSRSRINHVEARRDDPRRRMPDIAAARRELDWTPRTPLAEGLRRTIEYAEKELAGARQCTPTWVEIH
jgi:nucleoside-diphosphate-sugar epimerases